MQYKGLRNLALECRTSQLNSGLNITEQVYEDSVDNLMRVRCLCSEVKVMGGMSIGGESATIDKGYDSLCLTSLGVRFVIACVKE